VICESFTHSLKSCVIVITALVNNASRCIEENKEVLECESSKVLKLLLAATKLSACDVRTHIL